MTDRYRSFGELAAAESALSYRVEYTLRPSAVVVMAPHGGKIEPGTSEICRAIAGQERSCYLFEGCKSSKNSDLHITSTHFDEPQGVSAAESAQVVVTIHGQSGQEEFVNVGGLASTLVDALITRLNAEGYTGYRHSNPTLQGLSVDNICNRGKSGKGVQLEISRGLRDRLVQSSVELQRFASVIRTTLSMHGL